MPEKELHELKKEIKHVLIIEIILLSLLWIIWIGDTLFLNNIIKQNGIHPREIQSLIGIIFAPFLHSDINHIINNSIGIIMIATLVIMRDIHKFLIVCVFSILIGGIGIWLIGAPNTNHIGFSGVIFGLFGYLLSVGFFE